jgi:hypothetical protein
MAFSRFPRSLRSFSGLPRLVPALALGALALSAASRADAHITLMTPASWVVESAQGDPQKTGPCGGELGGAGITPTNMVTTYRVGERVSVSWKETVGHSGHFRISIASERDDLVDPPVVTESGDGVSGNSISAEILNPVAYPVLLDGLFPRENVAAGSPQVAPFTQEIVIPDMPGPATLQVIQFMAQHAPGYFYHHCADINIVAADAELPGAGDGAGGSAAVGVGGSASVGQAGSSTAAGGTAAGGTGGGASAGAAGSAGSGSSAEDDGGDDGGCSLPGGAGRSQAPAATLALVGLAIALGRRRAAR